MENDVVSIRFSEIVKMLRKKESLKQVDLAKKLGIDRSSISNYENGNRTPSPDFLISLSEHFNVSIDFLLKGKSYRSKSSKPTDAILNELMAENILLIDSVLELENKLEKTLEEKKALENLTKAQNKLLNL